MAQLVSVRLNKADAGSLGFRLQGGKDFGTPLIIQKVNIGSPAEKAGLLAGDSVIKINTTDVFNLRHKDAQDVIIRAGPSFEITIQRGGSTWKPSVTPLPKQAVSNSYSPVTKTSLAAKPQAPVGSIGTEHNLSAKPFSPQLNGAVNGTPKLVNKQYNTPLGLYSEQSIAETLSAQAEVLSTGVLGVNFKKNEKNYDASNSEVFRMVQEADKGPRDSEPVNRQNYYATQSHAIGGYATTPRSITPISDRSASRQGFGDYAPQKSGLCDQELTKCTECNRVIVGVFVRIKDKNLHVECFKCATCGASLKNVGYYNINHKLYCDIHAKLAAKSNPPAPNLVPVTVPPGGQAPAGTISAALATHSLPSAPASLSPLPSANTTAQPFLFDNQTDVLGENNRPAFAEICEQTEIDSVTNDDGQNSINKIYVTEKIVPIGERDNLKCRGPLPFSTYMKVRSSTSFSSPRPFSSVSGPLSPSVNSYATLPKSSPAPPSFSSPVSAPSSAAHVQINIQPTINGKQETEISTDLLNQDVSFSAPSLYSPVFARKNSPMMGKTQANFQSNDQEDSQNREKELKAPSVLSIAEGFGEKCNISQVSKLKPIISKVPPITESQNNNNNNAEIKNFQAGLQDTGDNYSSLDLNHSSQITLTSSEGNAFGPISLNFKIPKDARINNAILSETDDKNVSVGENNVGANTTKIDENMECKEVTPQDSDNHSKSVKLTTTSMLKQRDLKTNTMNNTNDIPVNNNKEIICCVCNTEIQRGPFITALGKIWCPEHFTCNTPTCKRPLHDLGFVEEQGKLYCEYCFEQYIAPPCSKCGAKVKGDCLKAIGKNFHPECFSCAYCGKLFGNSPFFLEDAQPYCETDWNELFTTKCFACGFPVEAGDRWVEALNNNYHSQCFNCTMCKKNLEGQSFFAKGGRPFCKNHAR